MHPLFDFPRKALSMGRSLMDGATELRPSMLTAESTAEAAHSGVIVVGETTQVVGEFRRVSVAISWAVGVLFASNSNTARTARLRNDSMVFRWPRGFSPFAASSSLIAFRPSNATSLQL